MLGTGLAEGLAVCWGPGLPGVWRLGVRPVFWGRACHWGRSTESDGIVNSPAERQPRRSVCFLATCPARQGRVLASSDVCCESRTKSFGDSHQILVNSLNKTISERLLCVGHGELIKKQLIRNWKLWANMGRERTNGHLE